MAEACECRVRHGEFAGIDHEIVPCHRHAEAHVKELEAELGGTKQLHGDALRNMGVLQIRLAWAERVVEAANYLLERYDVEHQMTARVFCELLDSSATAKPTPERRCTCGQWETVKRLEDALAAEPPGGTDA